MAPRIRAHDYQSIVCHCEGKVTKPPTDPSKLKQFTGTPPLPLQRPAWKKNFISLVLRLVSLEAAVESSEGKELDSEHREILEHVCLYFQTVVKPADKDGFDNLTRKLIEAGVAGRGFSFSKEGVMFFHDCLRKLQPYDLLNIATVGLFYEEWWCNYQARHDLATSKVPSVTPEIAESFQAASQATLQCLQRLKAADEGGSLTDVSARIINHSWTTSIMESGKLEPTFASDHPHTTALKKLNAVEYSGETEFLSPNEIDYLYEMYQDTRQSNLVTEKQQTPLSAEEENAYLVINAFRGIHAEVVTLFAGAFKEIDAQKSATYAFDPLYKLLPKVSKAESSKNRFGPGETQAILDSVQDKKVNSEKEPVKSFDDPSIKCTLKHATAHGELSHMFAHWVEQYPAEVNDAMLLSSKSLDDVFRNIGRKLKDADHHFRETDGGNDPVVLSSFEAAAVFRTYGALHLELLQKEAQCSFYAMFASTRWSTIFDYKKLLGVYHDKVQELMWVAATKKLCLYGTALEDRQLSSNDIAALRIKSEVQEHKVDLLTAQLDLLTSMNLNAQKIINGFIKREERRLCSEHKRTHTPTDTKTKLHDWQSYEKELEKKKQVVQRNLRKSMASEIQHSVLLDKKAWELMELLFSEVKKSGGNGLAARIVNQVFGTVIDGVQDPRLDMSFEERISDLQSITGAELTQEITNLNDSEKVRELKLTTALKGFYPPRTPECPRTKEELAGDWCFVPGLELSITRGELENALHESVTQQLQWQDVEAFGRSAAVEAQRFRELYDSHMLDCKKPKKGDGTVRRFREWTDKTLLRYPTPGIPPPLLDDDKLNQISTFIRTTITERDDALRRNRPLSQRIVAITAECDSKDLELTRAQNAARDREEALREKLRILESQLEAERAKTQRVRRESEETLVSRQKKLQDSFDKNAALKKELREYQETLNIEKLDHEVTRAMVEKAEASATRSRKTLLDGGAKFQAQKKELAEWMNEALMLRSNDQAEKDRIKKAVLDAVSEAEAQKNAEIVELNAFHSTKISELEDKNTHLNQIRLADENTIRELSQYKQSQQQNEFMLDYYQRQISDTNGIYAQQMSERAEEHRARMAEMAEESRARVQRYKLQLEAQKQATNALIAANDRLYEGEMRKREDEWKKRLSKAEMQIAMLKAEKNGGMEKWSNYG